jgi:aldose 1-epimerase
MAGVISLSSFDGTASARIQTDVGFNLFDWQANGNRSLLWSHPDFSGGLQRPSGSGIPILFPFPGRIAGSQFVWEGTTYVVDSDDGRGNAIHGFVYNHPWHAEQTAENSVRGIFRAADVDPTILDQWPADFELTTEYTLESRRLVSQFTIRSFERPLPCGLGLHPYFRINLQPDAAEVTLRAPVFHRWPLENMNPTGVTESTGNDLANGIVVNQIELDDVYSVRQDSDDTKLHEAFVGTADSGVFVQFDDNFPHCVLYTPPHREAICIEPYTCVPNAIAQTNTDSRNRFGLKVLRPHSSWTVNVTYRAESSF